MPHARDSAAPIRRWSTARRKLATDVRIADGSGRIPEARWMRAMTFERLVRDEKFVSEIATTTVGRLGLDRPTSVVTANALVQLNKTVALVSQAHTRALEYGAETLSTVSQSPSPASGRRRPPRSSPISSWWLPQSAKTRTWLIVGDAKDYEQVRSRIQATRLLKGFLQVAFGAEAARRGRGGRRGYAVWRPADGHLDLWRAFYPEWGELNCVAAPGDRGPAIGEGMAAPVARIWEQVGTGVPTLLEVAGLPDPEAADIDLPLMQAVELLAIDVDAIRRAVKVGFRLVRT